MVTGVIQAGSSLGILVPPSVVLVLYAMIARQPVGQLWLAGVLPGLMMASMFIVYIVIRCRLQPELGAGASSYGSGHIEGRKAQALACRASPPRHLRRDDGPFRQWLDQPGGKLGDRCADRVRRRRLEKAA